MGAPYLNALKHVLEGSGNDAPLAGGIWQSLHGERLPTACLAIGKNGPIVAFGDTLHERKPKHCAQSTDPTWVSIKQGTTLTSNTSLMGLNVVPRWRDFNSLRKEANLVQFTPPCSF
jgi:hypothetical protein